MYEILRQSMLNLNHHIDVTGAYAGNARLFEATGVGTLLITDWKPKFAGHARTARRSFGCRTPEECAEMVQLLSGTR